MKKILLVDDDPLILALYQHALKIAGYEIKTAVNGKEALALITAAPPDLVLLDVMMPLMDGLTVLRELHKTKVARPPVIVIAGNQREYQATREEARRAGAAAFLSKPFSPSQLLAIINEQLSKPQPSAESREDQAVPTAPMLSAQR